MRAKKQSRPPPDGSVVWKTKSVLLNPAVSNRNFDKPKNRAGQSSFPSRFVG